MNGIFVRLARLRVRWYLAATANAVRRHWQVALIAALLLPQMPLGQLAEVLAFPVTGLLQANRSSAWYLVHLVAVQAVAMIWVAIQRDNLAGGRLRAYLATLPLARTIGRRVNFVVLLFVDGLLLLPAVAALGLGAVTMPGLSAALYYAFGVVGLLALVLVVQLGVLERNWRITGGALLADPAWCWSLAHQPAWSASAAMIVTCVALAAWLVAGPAPGGHSARLLQPGRRRFELAAPRWLPLSVRLQLRALFMQHFLATALRMTAVLGAVVGAVLLIGIFRFDDRTLPTAILAMAASALVLSGAYRTLDDAHAPMRPYLRTLPLARGFWLVRDIALVLILGSVPLGVLLAALAGRGQGSALSWAALAVANLGLLALLRVPLLLVRRQTVLVGALMAGCWSAAAMAAVH